MDYRDAKAKLERIYHNNQALFNMAACYLLDIGIRNIEEVNIEEVRKQAEEKEKKILARGNFPGMSIDFQCSIVQVAKEIASCLTNPIDILVFANDVMSFYTGSPTKEDYKRYASELYWMAHEENLHDYDLEDWAEHVADYLDVEIEDIKDFVE